MNCLYITEAYTHIMKAMKRSSMRPSKPNTPSGIMSNGEMMYRARRRKRTKTRALKIITIPPTEKKSRKRLRNNAGRSRR